tara:strand:+ start:141 stop:593 length:453 start_codon:yes stop_codon:yes gene_type:complete
MSFVCSPLSFSNGGAYLFKPLISGSVAASFPSPADDYIDVGINLHERLINNPASTFFLRVNGHSMINAGIRDGDLLIVDRSLDARPGLIVVAIINGSFTIKRLTYKDGKLYLEAANPNYSPFEIDEHEDIQIWGVAIHSIHHLNKITAST